MKHTRKPKWSFVVMRGADKTVKQFHVSKRSVLAAPTAAVLAVTGCIGGLQIKSAYELHHLEEQLSMQDAEFSQTVTEKDEAITSLQQEILDLSSQTLEMKAKLDELQQLELKLKQFIENYGNKAAPSSYLAPSKTSSSSSRTLPILSSISSIHSTSLQESKKFALLAQNTGYDLASLHGMVDTMEESLALTLELAQTTKSSVDAYPSTWPTRSKLLTSGFGYRSDPFTGRSTFHAGIDITGKLGDPVLSAADGTVSEIGFNSSLGHYIVIDHLGGLQSAYMHLKQIEASEGDEIVRGEKIGLLGSSGRSTGPHLHFQIMQKNEPVNPIKFLALIKED
ncbi:M23 family metallopeptidase [Bacillus sp. FJAT-26390]|uniref:M23 family metallopeptidase n=1 Tax=Bacillus sp. FJAT-26390 TaxID=1743142 RepID=UPI0009E22893|nr:M23 family metallopeptidase [Bacillus sp. FJAT-26390]